VIAEHLLCSPAPEKAVPYFERALENLKKSCTRTARPFALFELAPEAARSPAAQAPWRPETLFPCRRLRNTSLACLNGLRASSERLFWVLRQTAEIHLRRRTLPPWKTR